MKRKTLLIIILMILLTISSALNLREIRMANDEKLKAESKINLFTEDIDKAYGYMEIINLSDIVDLSIELDSEENDSLAPTALIRKKELEEAKIEKEKRITGLIKSAHRLIGKKYVYGDTGNKGYDCSGLTYSLFLNSMGIEIPRNSSAQSTIGIKVDKSGLAPGDLLFFTTSGKGISHVGIYIGEGNMIHASSSKARVSIDSIEDSYFSKRYVTARRVYY